MRKLVILLLVSVLAAQFMSCASMSKATQGTAIGAAAGAGIGAVIGKQTGNTALGAILGAAVGGAAGAYIGNYMDKQAAEIQNDIEGAKVERVGEGIKITFKSGLLFNTGEATLQEQAKADLTRLSATLNKYSDTAVLIEGHTDDVGSDDFNMQLSQKRAQAVAAQLSANQVDPTRLTLMGYGESQPVVANDTPEGRQANRRVEIAIMANDKLKKAAEAQAK
ncbi:MAG: OmpA family protein [bacterium]|nr:OmpA family protein [bacterium]